MCHSQRTKTYKNDFGSGLGLKTLNGINIPGAVNRNFENSQATNAFNTILKIARLQVR